MENVIKVENLKKYYGSVKAVDGVSFEINSHQVFALLGPNGAGKSTTIEMLEGLRKPDSGKVEYFGREIKHVDDSIKERIGVQLQSTTFFDTLTVQETLQTFAGLYKNHLNIFTLMKEFELDDKRKARVKTLSGGQKQRLAVACALVNDPDIIFLDEPTTGLDPQARRMLWDVVMEQKKAGKTIILTTHYMDEAEYLADMINIVDHGKIIASGTVNNLIDSIGMKSIIKFTLDDAVIPKFAAINPKKITDNNYMIETQDVEEILVKLFDTAKENGIVMDDLVIRKPNLEDVFLKLTGRNLRD